MRRQTGLSSLINGFMGTYSAAQALQRADDDRQFVSMQRDRQQQQWADEDNLKASMRMAAEPATVDPNMVKSADQDNRDVGEAGEAAPTQQGFTVKGQQYASMGDANKAVETYNAPDAVTARMSTALMKAGKPVEAQQLRAGARQEKVADLQLSELQRSNVNRLYDEQLGGVGSFDALGEFLTNSKGDGRGGSLQAKMLPTADGKSVTLHTVNADGTTTATPYTFTNDARGLTQAKAMLSKSASVGDKLAHLHQQFMEQQSAKGQDATIAHQAGMLKVAQQNANTQEQYRRDQLALQREKAAPGKGAIEQFDEKLARETAHDAVKAENKRRGDANQPLLSGQQAAGLIDSYVGAQRAKHNDNLVIAAASNSLQGTDPASAEYASTYNRALALGNKEQIAAQLKARGFSPPTTGTPAQGARSGAAVPTSPQSAMTRAVMPAPRPAPSNPILATMAATAGNDSTLQGMAAARSERVTALGGQVSQAKQLLAAAAKSGDPTALNFYAQKLQDARNQFNAELASLPEDQRQKLTSIIESQ